MGAEGSVTFRLDDQSQNRVFAYYLYRDESGLYFDPNAPFASLVITDGAMVVGEDYPCSVTFTVGDAAASFSMAYYDASQNMVSEAVYALEDVEDYQRFEVDSNVSSVVVTCYDTQGTGFLTLTATREAPSVALCYEGGGQILPSKLLRFVWEED